MTQSYFNSQAEIWDEKIAEKDPEKLENMASRLDIQIDSTVLDVGTGTGVFIPFLLEKIGSKGKLICLDFAEEMLNKARAKGFKGNIRYICADIMNNKFESGFSDAVVCYSSFPHFQNKPAALKEIFRLLKSGGKLFICHTSSREAINRIHRQIPGFSQHLIPGDTEMTSLFSNAGFSQINICSDSKSYLARAVKP
jgi:ubiquinone/menaquinone biosynthesis C-methylase UbiE